MSRLTVVDSRRNPRLKRLRGAAADPRREGLALAEGLHLVAECLARGPRPAQLLVSENARGRPEVAKLLALAGNIDCLLVSEALFRETTGVASPSGIAAAFIPPHAAELVASRDMVLLDAIQDPGNVGTLLRTAAAAGVGQVFLGPRCASAWSLKVLRAGQGAHFTLNLVEQADLALILRQAGVQSVATVARDGQPLHELDLTPPTLWLFGSEGTGLSASLVRAATLRATIPLAAGTESLNVAAAAAVCLFEANRQRGTTKKPA